MDSPCPDPSPRSAPARDYWPTESWQTAAPADHGVDPDALARLSAHLDEAYPHFDSLLVVRNGYLLHEEYKNGAAPDDEHNVKSVTKSVLSALVGIALDTGDLAGIDEPIGSFFAGHFASIADRAKRAITLENLLTMRSGLEWNEWSGTTIQMTASPDWVRFVLERPLAQPPGERFSYSTGDTHLIAAALQQATGMTLLEYADLYLFQPLGITARRWPDDPQGVVIGGSELALRARDMAKLGLLYLSLGQWDDREIIPADWVRASTEPHITVVPQDASKRPPVCYGYLWWLRPQQRLGSFMAVGHGGQFIYALPDLDLCVVMTADLKTAPETFNDNRMIREFNVVEDFLIPAVQG
ncbi:MAG: serine hydrolase [Chloroflexi bacterium]|mgnify:CR=1 FL=1|nr:serine hydrolase [Chloroflexota bacterium]